MFYFFSCVSIPVLPYAKILLFYFKKKLCEPFYSENDSKKTRTVTFFPSAVREKDECWEYGEDKGHNKIQCKFCYKIIHGGITRFKNHLARRTGKGVDPCSEVPNEVSEKVQKIVDMKEERKEVSKRQKLSKTQPISNNPSTKVAKVRSPVVKMTILPHDNDDGELNEESHIANTSVDKLTPGEVASVSSSLVRIPLHGNADGALDTDRRIAELFFESNLDFSVVHSGLYKSISEAIGGPGYEGPNKDALKTVWLKKLKKEINLRIEKIKNDWGATGCTIWVHAWTDNISQALITFSVSSQSGTYFYKSFHVLYKNEERLYEIFDSVIQDLGPVNVVQVLIDDVLNYGNIGARIMEKYNTIFWSHCVSCCLHSILDEFCRLSWVNECIRSAQFVTRFIYNHKDALELMKKFTDGQELVRTGITESVSDILTLQCLLKHDTTLKGMFNSPEYRASYGGHETSIACRIILDDNNSFWKSLKEITSVSEPLLQVLRDILEGRTKIGSIYESMNKVNDSSKAYLPMNKGRCQLLLDIIEKKWLHELHSPLHQAAAYLNPSTHYSLDQDNLVVHKVELMKVLNKLIPESNITNQLSMFKNAKGLFGSSFAKKERNTTHPGTWWDVHGDEAPDLKRVAVKILSQVCSCSTLDTNWPLIQRIHLEKGNRLDKEILADRLFVNLNLKLKSEGNGVDLHPIEKNEIDMGSEWVWEIDNETYLPYQCNPNPTLMFE